MSRTAPPVSPSTNHLLPPEERFWQRYSPHNEFPLSGIGAITIYVLLGLLMVAGIHLNPFGSKDRPLAWDTMPAIEGEDPNATGPGDSGPPGDGAPGVPSVNAPPSQV